MKNYKYGAKAPTVNHELALHTLRLAHAYRNKLCELELARRAAVDSAIRETCPRLLELDALIAKCESSLEEELSGIRKTNAIQRRRGTPPESKVLLTEIRKTLRELRAEHKTVRSGLYSSQAVANINTAWAEQKRAARANCGVYWGTYLRVEAACESFQKGSPPRFERYLGSGCLGVQIQKGIPFADVLAGKPDTRLQWERTSDTHGNLWFRIGSEGREPKWCVIPISLHRTPPPGAIIKEVAVMRHVAGREWRQGDKLHRHAGHVSWSVMFTCQEPAGSPTGESIVGVDVGWRRIGDELRVAYAHGEHGNIDLRLTKRDLDAMEKARHMQSVRDQNMTDIRSSLLEFRQSRDDLPEWWQERTATLHSWKSPYAMAQFVVAWRDQRFHGDDSIYKLAEDWRLRDNHLGRYQAGLRGSIAGRRMDAYRVFAAGLARKYRYVALEMFDLRDVGERPKADEPDEASNTQRAFQRLANVSLLRACLREKLECLIVAAEQTTQQCSGCGQEMDVDAAASVVITCPHCGNAHDQDINAAINILARGEAMLTERHSLANQGANGVTSSGETPVKSTRRARFAAAREKRSQAKRDKQIQ